MFMCIFLHGWQHYAKLRYWRKNDIVKLLLFHIVFFLLLCYHVYGEIKIIITLATTSSRVRGHFHLPEIGAIPSFRKFRSADVWSRLYCTLQWCHQLELQHSMTMTLPLYVKLHLSPNWTRFLRCWRCHPRRYHFDMPRRPQTRREVLGRCRSAATNASICSPAADSIHSATSGRVDPSGRVVICLPVNFKRDYGLDRIPSSHVMPPGDSHASPPDDDCQSVSITTQRICSVTAEYTAPLGLLMLPRLSALLTCCCCCFFDQLSSKCWHTSRLNGVDCA